MVKLFSVVEMKALENEANKAGLTYELMMQNAGNGIAKEVHAAYSHINNKEIVALIGSGNNGGDALVALSQLAQQNWQAHAYIIRKRAHDDPLVMHLQENGGDIIDFEEDKQFERLRKLLDSCSVLLDGVLGTGITLPLKGEISEVLSFINSYLANTIHKPQIVAVDCPSGVDCDTGETAPEALPADITVTMAGIKSGLLRFPAAGITGDLKVASIGDINKFAAFDHNQKYVLFTEDIKTILPKRPANSHKGTFGTAFIIAGSVNYTGAALLAGMAAYRIGAGLVTMAVPAPLHEALSGQFPESTWVILPHELGVISSGAAQVVSQNLDRATAVLLGPGLGLQDTTKDFIAKLFKDRTRHEKSKIGFLGELEQETGEKNQQKPIIIDADGLKLLSKIPDWPKLINSPAILTPHPGEMAVLTGLSTDEIQQNRIEVAKEYSAKWGHVVVLKGAFTVIANNDGQIAVVPVASAALARAGTGDVLAGLIVGLRAQGVDAYQSACAGAWIHAQAGLLAAKKIGNTASVLASDVLNAVPDIINQLM